jgi:hypothetical protein
MLARPSLRKAKERVLSSPHVLFAHQRNLNAGGHSRFWAITQNSPFVPFGAIEIGRVPVDGAMPIVVLIPQLERRLIDLYDVDGSRSFGLCRSPLRGQAHWPTCAPNAYLFNLVAPRL